MSISYEDLISSSRTDLLELEPDGLIYEDTKDPDYLEQFVKVRHKVFSEYDEFLSQALKPDEGWDYGLDTHVLTVRDKDKVVAGGTVVINNCYTNEMLPFECETMRLYKEFPEYELSKNSYAAFKQTAVLKEYRTGTCLQNIFKCVYNLCVEQEVKFLFGIAPMSRARRNKISLHKLKVGLDVKISEMENFPRPEWWWENSEIYLQTIDLRPIFTQNNNL